MVEEIVLRTQGRGPAEFRRNKTSYVSCSRGVDQGKLRIAADCRDDRVNSSQLESEVTGVGVVDLVGTGVSDHGI
jgi:hypothetical protein